MAEQLTGPRARPLLASEAAANSETRSRYLPSAWSSCGGALGNHVEGGVVGTKPSQRSSRAEKGRGGIVAAVMTTHSMAFRNAHAWRPLVEDVEQRPDAAVSGPWQVKAVRHVHSPVGDSRAYRGAMAILPRSRGTEPSKEQALADARKATAGLRRSLRKARRYQRGKQDNPVEEMTPNQWAGGTRW
jgi:hypothetical protein